MVTDVIGQKEYQTNIDALAVCQRQVSVHVDELLIEEIRVLKIGPGVQGLWHVLLLPLAGCHQKMARGTAKRYHEGFYVQVPPTGRYMLIGPQEENGTRPGIVSAG